MSKKILVAFAAVVALSAFTASSAMADDWNTTSNAPITGPTDVLISSPALSLSLPSLGGATVTCAVDGSGSLDVSAGGALDDFVINTSSCNTHIANCTVTATSSTAASSPWGVLGDATAQTADLTGLGFTNTFANTPFCGALAGQTIIAGASQGDGDVTPSFDASAQQFKFNGANSTREVNTNGWGLARISGNVDVCVDDGTGACDAGETITLTP